MVAVISSLLDTKDDGEFRSRFSQAITALLVKETRKPKNGRRKDFVNFVERVNPHGLHFELVKLKGEANNM